MTDILSSPFLSRLTFDVRLEIYSHLILPPFGGCRAYTGLFLSCQQLKKETECEGLRQLRMHLNKVSIAEPRRAYKGCSEEAEARDELARVGYMTFVDPTTIPEASTIRVKVPFILPHPNHDWHPGHNSPWRGCTPFPSSTAEQERERREKLYKVQVSYLLDPLARLYSLYTASIDIELVASDAMRIRMAGDHNLLRASRRRGAHNLESTALGGLLRFYIQGLAEQTYFSMIEMPDDWAFNVRSVKLAWNFSPHSIAVSSQDLQHYKCGRTGYFDGLTTQVRCNLERLRGTPEINLDVVKCIQMQARDLKELIGEDESRGQVGPGSYGFSMYGTADNDDALARIREKLRKLGAIEDEDLPEKTGDRVLFKAIVQMKLRRQMTGS